MGLMHGHPAGAFLANSAERRSERLGSGDRGSRRKTAGHTLRSFGVAAVSSAMLWGIILVAAGLN